ncbi:precorrin-8X/cobalt-precorrin-8 methylmutase [Halodesulfurarchaeum formicicum]|uniref:Precorrin-8X/cobalt-precorrin-8 methylmutase n=1 Tax=Halodesulfurarchaeum formicicum TaxID=1873524 RepID=A0A1D8S6M9_9EURY|nr:precorrin-8X methylmutase [Halodesulfurarchaeum formicicum]AOW81014.1 precorrin-8X/cobalt-precorrin-8 methylmutase [Halodesulfurarchaeum formicicum]
MTDASETDLGATTEDGDAIAEASLDIVSKLVPGDTLPDRFRRKAVHATGDPEFQYLMRFGNDPIHSGAEAVLSGAPIVTDVNMPRHGITDRGHDCEKYTALGEGDDRAEETGITRTEAGVIALDEQGVYDDAIAVIGNAPTAALSLAERIEAGTRPAAVVATPVGFIKAAESRARLREAGEATGVPTITNVGRRGGSGLAAALTNELIHVATDIGDGVIEV